MSAPQTAETFADDVNTWDQPTWSIAELERAKAGRTVSVILPALNEEQTVAAVVDTVRPLLGGLVDELIVLDSGSEDLTVERARGAGATVISREEAVPTVSPVPGPVRARLAEMADLVDMEGYAVAAAGAALGVPTRLVKHVSDPADESAGDTWVEGVDACARVLAEWVGSRLG